MIDDDEIGAAQDFLAQLTSRQLAQLAGVLLPAAEAGEAGPYSHLVLELIADEADERLMARAA